RRRRELVLARAGAGGVRDDGARPVVLPQRDDGRRGLLTHRDTGVPGRAGGQGGQGAGQQILELTRLGREEELEGPCRRRVRRRLFRGAGRGRDGRLVLLVRAVDGVDRVVNGGV